MNKYLRTALAGLAGYALNWSGAVGKARRNIKAGHILPLYFHNPDKKLFKQIVNWLRANYFEFLSTRELVHLVINNSRREGRMAWISFDDGWRDNIDHVIPTLIEYDIPATFFISTYPVEDSGYFWWSAVKKNNPELPPEDRLGLEQLWHLPWHEVKDRINRKIGDRKPIEREAMTIQEVIDISKLPQVTIGCHGVHHMMATACSDEELEEELVGSRASLERWTGKPVRYFAYPRGAYGPREKSFLVRHGYELAAGIDKQIITGAPDLFALPRFGVLNQAFFSEAICHVLGIWQPFKQKFKLSR